MKHCTLFFRNARMHKIYGIDFDSIFQKVALPVLNPQSAIFGFTDVLDHNYLLVNHLLLIFKYNIYNSRVNNTLSFQSLKCVISQIKYKIIKIGSKLFFTLLLSLLLILLLLLLLFSYYYYCY